MHGYTFSLTDPNSMYYAQHLAVDIDVYYYAQKAEEQLPKQWYCSDIQTVEL